MSEKITKNEIFKLYNDLLTSLDENSEIDEILDKLIEKIEELEELDGAKKEKLLKELNEIRSALHNENEGEDPGNAARMLCNLRTTTAVKKSKKFRFDLKIKLSSFGTLLFSCIRGGEDDDDEGVGASVSYESEKTIETQNFDSDDDDTKASTNLN